jgi:hypothetical protein
MSAIGGNLMSIYSRTDLVLLASTVRLSARAATAIAAKN